MGRTRTKALGFPLLCLLLSIALTTGCASASKKDFGTAAGALFGAAAGYLVDDGGTAGIVVGAAVGGLIGRMVGDYMDESDRRKMSAALNNSPTGRTTRWSNPDSGNEFALTPTSELHADGDEQCRNFEQEIVVDGEKQAIQAVACKQSGEDDWDVTA